MAARTKKITHDPKTKRLIQASQLLNRLIKHAMGEVEMTQSPVNAARIVIGKSIPDLSAVQYTGELTVKGANELSRDELLSIASTGGKGTVSQARRAKQPDSVH